MKFSNMGTPYRVVRQGSLSKDGKFQVIEVDKEDMRDYINSFAESSDISVIVKRAMNGEPELLNANKGMYGDFSQFPKTYAEVLQKVIDANTLFESLSVDVRSKFDNDVYKFISSMDDPDWAVKAGFVKPSEEEKEVTE